MPNPKIVIVLTKNGIDSVTVSAHDTLSRLKGYEICQSLEGQLATLGEIAKRGLSSEEREGEQH